MSWDTFPVTLLKNVGRFNARKGSLPWFFKSLQACVFMYCGDYVRVVPALPSNCWVQPCHGDDWALLVSAAHNSRSSTCADKSSFNSFKKVHLFLQTSLLLLVFRCFLSLCKNERVEKVYGIHFFFCRRCKTFVFVGARHFIGNIA